LSRDGNLMLVKQLRNSIQRLRSKQNEDYVFGVNPPEPRVTKNIFQPQRDLFQIVDEIEIARQLTFSFLNSFLSYPYERNNTNSNNSFYSSQFD
jgi:hypothetical protein